MGKPSHIYASKRSDFHAYSVPVQKVQDGSAYYGPYPSVTTMKSILKLIRGFIQLRNCNFVLSEKNIQAGKFKKCLEFQIGNCAGPCEGLQSEEDYMKGIEQVKHILKGNFGPVLQHLETQMKLAAEEYAFEKAEFFKKRLENVRAYKRKNTVVSTKISNLEVFTVLSEQNLSVVNHFKVNEGAIIQTHSWEIKRNLQEEEEELLTAVIDQMVADKEQLFPQIISNVKLNQTSLPENISISVPQKGDKRHLIDLSLKNCKVLLTEKLYTQNFKKRRSHAEVMVDELQKELRLISPPDHIECFDNSNFQGSSPVASVVVFKNGKPAKREYRHFNIKTVEGPNDFASMEEIVERRYKRLLAENQPLPKLIVIDGGKGQLSSAAAALERVGLLGQIPMVGVAKRLEEIYRVGDPIPLYIDKKSQALHLIQQVRNEAHRFAITFHRNKRSKAPGQRSKLTSIKGIGEQAEQEILKQFKSVKKLKAASQAELEAKIGKHKAKLIRKAIEEEKL